MTHLVLSRVLDEFFDLRFIKFLLVGGVNTFSCTFFAFLCLYILPDANIAFIIGYVLSNILAYILNSIFVFPCSLSWSRYLKFALSYIPNFLCENLVVAVCYNLMGIPPVISYLLAAVIAVFVTYLCVKYFAFGVKKHD